MRPLPDLRMAQKPEVQKLLFDLTVIKFMAWDYDAKDKKNVLVDFKIPHMSKLGPICKWYALCTNQPPQLLLHASKCLWPNVFGSLQPPTDFQTRIATCKQTLIQKAATTAVKKARCIVDENADEEGDDESCGEQEEAFVQVSVPISSVPVPTPVLAPVPAFAKDVPIKTALVTSKPQPVPMLEGKSKPVSAPVPEGKSKPVLLSVPVVPIKIVPVVVLSSEIKSVPEVASKTALSKSKSLLVQPTMSKSVSAASFVCLNCRQFNVCMCVPPVKPTPSPVKMKSVAKKPAPSSPVKPEFSSSSFEVDDTFRERASCLFAALPNVVMEPFGCDDLTNDMFCLLPLQAINLKIQNCIKSVNVRLEDFPPNKIAFFFDPTCDLWALAMRVNIVYTLKDAGRAINAPLKVSQKNKVYL